MAFPSSPVNSQQATVNNILYTYNSAKSAWIRTSSISGDVVANSITVLTSLTCTGNIIAGGVRRTTSTTAPTNAGVGDLWYDTATDIMFQYIYDGTNYIWVDINSLAVNSNAIVAGTTLSISGNGTISGNTTLGGATTHVGVVYANSGISSSSTTTGALVVTGGIGASGNITASNVTANHYGTIMTAAQTNITSVGNLSSLSASGTIQTTGVVYGNSGVGGTLLTAAQTNITSVGNLSSLSASGTIQTTGVVYGNSGVGGTLLTAAQTNITSVGNLTSLSVAGASSHIGIVYANAAIASSSNTTGSMVVIGGIGASGNTVINNLYIGDWPGTTSYRSIRHSAMTGQEYCMLTGDSDNNTYISARTNANVVIRGGANSSTYQLTVGTTYIALNNTITLNSTGSATAIINGATAGVGNIGASGQGFNTVFAKATSAQYADLAEKYTSDADYHSGAVLVFGGTHEVTVSSTSHDPAVAGVVTTNPAYLMNDSIEGVAVALTGRVPCWVQGPVNKGDRLVTSDLYGVAQRLDKSLYEPGCIIGKSLEEINNDEIKLIEIAIGRF